MAGTKDDASTDIDKVATAFAKAMGDAASDLLSEATESASDLSGKGAAASPQIQFVVGQAPKGAFRTPAEQAAEIVDGKSGSCWSAHMADKARDLVMKVDGKVTWDLKKTFGSSLEAFTKSWGTIMKQQGLVNAAGKPGWYAQDGFHLELPESEIAKADQRAAACLEEYVRLTRQKGKKKNEKFEKKHAGDLAPYIKAADKAGDKK